MTPEQFVYWLKGIAETAEHAPTDKQWQVITDHLDAVFTKVTPDRKPLSTDEIDRFRDAIRPQRIQRATFGSELIC